LSLISVRSQLFLILSLAAVALTGGVAASARDQVSVPGAKSAVLVELFTSQGCSSCPPADRLLTELAARDDIEIIPLSFHVDYWNYIGWTDPFSSKAWSNRQRRYGQHFGGDRIYTPQMIVNGRWEGVGSNRTQIARLLERASTERPKAELGITAKLVSDDRLKVSVTSARIDAKVESNLWSAWVAVVESDLVTPVGRGENAAKTLRNDWVVRRLERVSGLEPIKAGATASLEVILEDDWRRDKLSAVTFLQDSGSLRIHATATCSLGDSD
jgi:hypothetical protein